MNDTIVNHVADWLNGAGQNDDVPTAEVWGLLEIMGHRRHYGRLTEVEKFGAKLCRVDVPTQSAAPLLGEPEQFETHVYAGAAIFSFTPMTEEAARKAAEQDRPRPYSPVARLPAPYDEDDYEERPF